MRVEHSELGLCPRCDAPLAEYKYTLEGPTGDGSVYVRISISCPVCGYSEAKNILFPLRALYLMRYMLVPELRLEVEKMYVAATHITGNE